MCVVLASKVQLLWHLCGDENPPKYNLCGNFGALVLRCVFGASKVQPLQPLCGDENPPKYNLFGNFGALVLRYIFINRVL